MYLGQALETASGTHTMTGAIPAVSTMSERRSARRYVEARALADGPLFSVGEIVRGHEFHYSSTRYSDARPAFTIEDVHEGYVAKNVHASYVHVHLGARPEAARRLAARARAYRRGRSQ